MKYKKSWIILLILSIILVTTFATSIISTVNFNNQLIAENLTFNSAGNITRTLSIYGYANNITFVFLNLTGYSNGTKLYQASDVGAGSANSGQYFYGQNKTFTNAGYLKLFEISTAGALAGETCFLQDAVNGTTLMSGNMTTNKNCTLNSPAYIPAGASRFMVINVTKIGFGTNLLGAAGGQGAAFQCNQSILNCEAAGSMDLYMDFYEAQYPVNISVTIGDRLNSSLCLQETANISTSCGGLSTGVYTGITTNEYDGNWSTCDVVTTEDIRINYTIPLQTTSANWTISGKALGVCGDGQCACSTNSTVTIPSECFVNVIQLRVNRTTIPTNKNALTYYCFNYTLSDWLELGATSRSTSVVFNEESITWNISTGNLSTIYMFTGIFNQTNNRTDDFSFLLTKYLNMSYLVDSNYSIPFIFHSDSSGILQYSDINITYTTSPLVTLFSPANGTSAATSKIFTCNVSDATNLQNITFYIWNSTGFLNNSMSASISNLYNSTEFTFNFLVTDTYIWNCQAYNVENFSSFQSSNYTIFGTAGTPALTLNAPSNNKFTSQSNMSFNCTIEGTALDAIMLYINSTGTFKLNQSISGVTSGVQYNQSLVLADGAYKWICAGNQTSSSTITYSQGGNRTLTIDTILPNPAINSIIAAAGSQTITFTNTIIETNSNNCKYSIFDSTGAVNGLNSNISFTCGSSTQATVTAFGTYNLTIYAIDKAGNENLTTSEFTTSATSGTTGGGGPTIIVIGGNLTWNMKTEQNNQIYDLIIPLGTARTKNLIYTNNGQNTETISMSCTGDLCQYITFANPSVNLPIGLSINTINSFTISLPEKLENNTYIMNLKGTDSAGKTHIVTLKVSISLAGTIPAAIEKLTIFPYFFVFLISGVLIFLMMFFILKTMHVESFRAGISIITALFGALFIIAVF